MSSVDLAALFWRLAELTNELGCNYEITGIHSTYIRGRIVEWVSRKEVVRVAEEYRIEKVVTALIREAETLRNERDGFKAMFTKEATDGRD